MLILFFSSWFLKEVLFILVNNNIYFSIIFELEFSNICQWADSFFPIFSPLSLNFHFINFFLHFFNHFKLSKSIVSFLLFLKPLLFYFHFCPSSFCWWFHQIRRNSFLKANRCALWEYFSNFRVHIYHHFPLFFDLFIALLNLLVNPFTEWISNNSIYNID